jgi:hypothetical protein
MNSTSEFERHPPRNEELVVVACLMVIEDEDGIGISVFSNENLRDNRAFSKMYEYL